MGGGGSGCVGELRSFPLTCDYQPDPQCISPNVIHKGKQLGRGSVTYSILHPRRLLSLHRFFVLVVIAVIALLVPSRVVRQKSFSLIQRRGGSALHFAKVPAYNTDVSRVSPRPTTTTREGWGGEVLLVSGGDTCGGGRGGGSTRASGAPLSSSSTALAL